MDEEDDTAELQHELDPVYLSLYLDTLRQTKTHLLGHDGTNAGPLPPSFILPTGFWSSQEKDAFFHALSIYSRLRPDLIADCIKTKSVVDVCNYMEILEDAVHKAEPVGRKSIPGVMEVSEEWIKFEEQKAIGVIGSEESWDKEALEEIREEKISARRKLLRAEKARGAFRPWMDGQRERWNKEDFCKALGSHELAAIDTILREAEETIPPHTELGSKVITQSRLNTVSRDCSVPSLMSHSRLQVPAAIDVSLIDPALLALSRTPESSFAPHANSQFGPLSPASGPFAPFKEELSFPGPSVTPADLSPASRRRHEKRLYMRRKRAGLTGQEIDDNVGRLKPGRKAKKLVRSQSATAGITSEAMGVDDKEESDFHRPHVSGMTLPYKILSKFTELGIDAEVLTDLGLDLFHLGGLSKLINLYALLHDGGSTPGSQISHETIHLLRAHVVHFVKNLIYCVIVIREQELSLKVHTKVWKISDKQVVTKENVNRALEIMGSGRIKEQYFRRLKERFEAQADSEEGDDGSALDSEQAPGALEPFAASGTDGIPFRLSMNREVYTPFIRLPTFADGDLLMQEDTDEDELLTELLQEEELDKMDRVLDEMHEKGLWERFRDARITRGRNRWGDDDGGASAQHDPLNNARPSGGAD